MPVTACILRRLPLCLFLCVLTMGLPSEAGAFVKIKPVLETIGEIGLNFFRKEVPKSPGPRFSFLRGGSSQALAVNIGLKKPSWAAHHLIPSELAGLGAGGSPHPALVKAGLYMDDARNGIGLPMKPNQDPILPLHAGSHPAYTQYVKSVLDKIPTGYTREQTQEAIGKIQDALKKCLTDGIPLHEKYGAQSPWHCKYTDMLVGEF